MAVNYYKELELSVEAYESDISKLEKVLDDKVKEWKSHKDLNVRNKVSLYEGEIKKAIHEPAVWKKYYEEYKREKNDEIGNRLTMVAELDEIQLTKVAKNCNVSLNYVKKYCKEHGIVMSVPEQTKEGVTLESIVPKSYKEFEKGNSIIKPLGYYSIKEFLENEIVKQERKKTNIVLKNVKKDDILQDLKDIKEVWKKKAVKADTSSKKTAIDRYCQQMMKYFKDNGNSIDEYIGCLNYLKLVEILSEMKKMYIESESQSGLAEQYYYKKIDEIYEIVGSKDVAKSILVSYCNENSITIPKETPNRLVCPFCHNSFKKEKEIKNNCPVCRKSFIISCPKCHKTKNIIVDIECCGIDLGKYPQYIKHAEEIEELCDKLFLDEALAQADDIEKDWPGIEEVMKVRDRVQKISVSHKKELEDIETACAENKYFKAKSIFESKLLGLYPLSKERYQYVIYNNIEEAKNDFEKYKKEISKDVKENLLLDIVTRVADFPEANLELKKYPIGSISEVKTFVNKQTGTVSLSWNSTNKSNSVNYHIRRKEGARLSNEKDGVELDTTRLTSFDDTWAEDGKVYYYGIYAERGPISSAICITSEPTIFLKDPDVNVVSKDRAIDLSWNSVGVNEKVKVVYSKNNLGSDSETGTEYEKVSANGCIIDNLINDTLYYIKVIKTLTVDGKEYTSNGKIYSSIPAKLIEPPKVTKAIGGEAGKYVLKHQNADSTLQLEFYYSDKRDVFRPAATTEVTNLQTKLKKLDVINSENDEYQVTLNGKKSIFVYPAIVRSRVATIGNILELTYMKPMKITGHTLNGANVTLHYDEWPDDVDKIWLCYNNDSYPKDNRDYTYKQEIYKGSALEIKNIPKEKMYISVYGYRRAEYVPLGNYFINNAELSKITYSFSRRLGGGIKIKLIYSSDSRPELRLVTKERIIPLSEKDGAAMYTIPAKTNITPGSSEVISIPGSVKRESHGKLFTSDRGFELILDGLSKL